MRRANSPTASTVRGIDGSDEVRWIAMEKVEGVTLRTWLETRGAMPIERCLRLGRPCEVSALAADDHRAGVRTKISPCCWGVAMNSLVALAPLAKFLRMIAVASSTVAGCGACARSAGGRSRR